MNRSRTESTATAPSLQLESRLERLFNRIDYERRSVEKDDFKLANMVELVRRLGDPQSCYPIIHIAGTKGKGSVANFVGSILSCSGRKTGVYTSPHLESIHQRMVINGESISDQQLSDVLAVIEPVIAQMDSEAEQTGQRKPTFFEVTTAAAMLHFARESCDAVVLEVGLGGRLDSTNVCLPVVSVITNISLDHTRQLGNRVNEIAAEKAGIIKPGVPVISGACHPEVIPVIQGRAQEMEADLWQLERDFHWQESPESSHSVCSSFRTSGIIDGQDYAIDQLELTVAGKHQCANAAIAVAVCQVLNQVEWAISDNDIRSGLKRTQLTGRTEVICEQPKVIVDMAHNVASAMALADTLNEGLIDSESERVLIVAISQEKDARGMLEPLLPLFQTVILTRYQNNPRGRSIEELDTIVTSICETHQLSRQLQSAETPEIAWDLARQSGSPFICVTGSAFLIAELRPVIIRTDFCQD